MNDDEITTAFEDAAARVHVPGGDVDRVIERATHRARRQRRALSAVTVVALLTASVGVVRVTSTRNSRGETPVTAGAPADGTNGDVSGFERVSLGLSWRTVNASTALGAERALTADGPIYALSTAPGERYSDKKPPSRVVWRSDDGIEWTAASTLGNDLYLADLATHDERVYAVGTAPAEAFSPGRKPVSPLVVGWSDDKAKTWQHARLPIDWASITANTTSAYTSWTRIASGKHGTVAGAALWSELDVRGLLPDGVTAPNGWATTNDGVDVLGPLRADVCSEGEQPEPVEAATEPPGEVHPVWCAPADGSTERIVKGASVSPQDARGVVASYTWDQLGVDGDLRKAVRHEPFVFYAPPGSTEFEAIDFPEVSNPNGMLTVEAIGDRFVVATSSGGDRYGMSAGRLAVFESSDGRTWTRGDTPSDVQWISSLGELDGSPAVVANTANGPFLYTSDGDGGWAAQALSSLLDSDVRKGYEVNAGVSTFGPFGLAVSVLTYPKDGAGDDREVEQWMLVTRDGRRWEVVSMRDVVDQPHGIIGRLTIVGDTIVAAISVPAASGKPSDPRRHVTVVGSAA